MTTPIAPLTSQQIAFLDADGRKGSPAGRLAGSILLGARLSEFDASRLTNTFEDPGASGTLTPLTTGVCNFISAGAESRTLGAPSYAGQTVILSMQVDGGDITLGLPNHVAAAGASDTATFDDEGDLLELIAVPLGVGGALGWRVRSNTGVGLA